MKVGRPKIDSELKKEKRRLYMEEYYKKNTERMKKNSLDRYRKLKAGAVQNIVESSSLSSSEPSDVAQ
jgi:hypothetical protein